MVKPFRHLPWLSMLDRKLVRDLWTLRTQAVAIALVIASGVAVHLVASGMLDSLQETRRAYYERYRFADIWAPVVRAPDALASDLRTIDGVVAVETRLRAHALLDMPGMAAPASADVLSLPEGRDPGTDFPSANALRDDQTAPDSNSDRICYLAFTSGTTGTPKCVMHSSNTILRSNASSSSPRTTRPAAHAAATCGSVGAAEQQRHTVGFPDCRHLRTRFRVVANAGKRRRQAPQSPPICHNCI